MSLKFAAVGSLTVLNSLGFSANAGSRVRNSGAAEPYDPLLALIGVAIKAEPLPRLRREPLTAIADKR
jgi:hypothetical protein